MSSRTEQVALMYLHDKGMKVEKLSDELKALLPFIDLRELCAKWVRLDRKNGKSLGQIATKYGLSQRQVKYILSKN